MTNETFFEMVTSGDITEGSSQLVSIDTIRLLGDGKVAAATYTSDNYFTYKGKLRQ